MLQNARGIYHGMRFEGVSGWPLAFSSIYIFPLTDQSFSSELSSQEDAENTILVPFLTSGSV